MDERKEPANAPRPEWQYRLLPCVCGSMDAEYIRNAGEPEMGDVIYKVRCCACGRETLPNRCAHDAQIEWNETYRAAVREGSSRE